jgi:alkylation response protein AidB-like acyl-CoA dehydrogenase
MNDFAPAVDEICFALRVWGRTPELLSTIHAEQRWDTVEAIVREAGRFAAEVLAPIDANGHKEGCALLADGGVRTPTGWVTAYAKFVEAEWNRVHFSSDVGGSGLPAPVSIAVAELFEAANVAFSLALMPFAGVVTLVQQFGTPEQKRRYLEPLVSGRWSATLAMTEAHAGTDIGAVLTKAAEDPEGARIRGQKCFISYGEHAMTENIVHFVLARDPSGKPGVKGLSLYLVPKRLVGEDGSLGGHNNVRCLAVEKKMGIHGSPTTIMQFGGDGQGALGERLGDACKGLEHMFVVLNRARLNIGVFGLASAERALQAAESYANERVQGSDAHGKPCVIARHPDVQRMLLEMRCAVDAIRSVSYYASGVLARSNLDADEQQRECHRRRLDLLTPIVKGWGTELAFEAASIGVQVAGGIGYMDESVAARCFLDARVHPIYEGTTGIQALDLALRKVGRSGGAAAAHELLAEMRATWPLQLEVAQMEDLAGDVAEAIHALDTATAFVMEQAVSRPDVVQAIAVHYLLMWGAVVSAWLMCGAATDSIRRERARFTILHRLVRVHMHLRIVQRGAPEVLSAVRKPCV